MPRPVPQLIPLARKKDRPTCVLLPGLGGGLQPYLRLAGALGTDRNVYAMRAAGLMPGEEPEKSIVDIASATRDVLRTAGVTPDLVVGWSLGGVVGWELNLQLDRPVPLVIIDSVPCPWAGTEYGSAKLRERVTGMLGPQADPETLDRVLTTIDIHLDALAAHSTSVRYDGPVLLIAGEGDAEWGAEGWREAAIDGWHALAPRLRVERIAAGHFEILDHPAEIAGFVADFVAGEQL